MIVRLPVKTLISNRILNTILKNKLFVHCFIVCYCQLIINLSIVCYTVMTENVKLKLLVIDAFNKHLLLLLHPHKTRSYLSQTCHTVYQGLLKQLFSANYSYAYVTAFSRNVFPCRYFGVGVYIEWKIYLIKRILPYNFQKAQFENNCWHLFDTHFHVNVNRHMLSLRKHIYT